MKRPTKADDGLYHYKGKTYKMVRGSRAQVWNRTAIKTEGGLHRSALTQSHGRIVSLKKHKTAKKELRLQKYGYFAEKGKFGYVKKTMSKRKSAKRKGGSLADTAGKFSGGNAEYPAAYGGISVAAASSVPATSAAAMNAGSATSAATTMSATTAATTNPVVM